MASLRAPMPSDVLFSIDNVGGEQKIKKVFTPSDVLFSTEKYRWRANEKKIVSRSSLSSKRCNAPLLGCQCATHGARATGWPLLADRIGPIGKVHDLQRSKNNLQLVCFRQNKLYLPVARVIKSIAIGGGIVVLSNLVGLEIEF